jgi:hypothetical protein
MVALVILGIVLVIAFARINPWLTAMLISGVIGYVIGSVFMAYGHTPAWVLPANIVIWIVGSTPGIAGFLITIVPPRRRRDDYPRRPARMG